MGREGWDDTEEPFWKKGGRVEEEVSGGVWSD